MSLDDRLQIAVQSFWEGRNRQQQKQVEGGRIDGGTRGAVTGGSQMGGLEVLITDILQEAGLEQISVRTKLGLELPGYFRPEKKWDLLVVSRDHLVCAVEFKSQVGPSFGNNFNNRSEEAIGNAVDVWTAFREGLFSTSPRPFVGYFFLLEDCEKVHRSVKVAQPHFPVDPIFRGTSYAQRYEILCRRLMLERHYEGVCLALATNEAPTKVSHPAEDLSFRRFVAELQGAAARFMASAP